MQLATKAMAILGLAALLWPASALAQANDPLQPVVLTLTGPEEVTLGGTARIVASFYDGNGKPITGARIVFTSPVAFVGIVDEMAIGEALTDADGIAALDHQLRIQGQNKIIARFYGDETFQPAEASTLLVATGQAQLAQRTAGIDLPVVGSWTLIAVIGAVWAVYFAALFLIAGIPGDAARPAALAKGGDR
jgi:hypothetical protein